MSGENQGNIRAIIQKEGKKLVLLEHPWVPGAFIYTEADLSPGPVIGGVMPLFTSGETGSGLCKCLRPQS